MSLGGSNAMVGLVASAYPIATFLGATPCGLMMRHLQNSLTACLALALMVMTSVLSFAAESVYMLLGIRLLGGLGNTSFDIAQKFYVSKEVPADIRGRIAARIAGTQKWATVCLAKPCSLGGRKQE